MRSVLIGRGHSIHRNKVVGTSIVVRPFIVYTQCTSFSPCDIHQCRTAAYEGTFIAISLRLCVGFLNDHF